MSTKVLLDTDIGVEFANEQEGGLTRWHAWHPGNADPRHEVALEVKPQHFFTHYFGVFYSLDCLWQTSTIG